MKESEMPSGVTADLWCPVKVMLLQSVIEQTSDYLNITSELLQEQLEAKWWRKQRNAWGNKSEVAEWQSIKVHVRQRKTGKCVKIIHSWSGREIQWGLSQQGLMMESFGLKDFLISSWQALVLTR